MLLKAGADVRVIARELNGDFQKALQAGEITHQAEEFVPSDLDGIFLAIAATDRKAVNALVYQSANQRQVMVNVVDDMQRCSLLCLLSSIVRRSLLPFPLQARLLSCSFSS